MTELERALIALGAELDVPAAPDLRAPVAGRLADRRRLHLGRRALVLALAVALVALAAALAVPGARSAILRFLHLRGETVELVGTLPRARERPLLSGFAGPVSPARAETLLGFRIRVPAGVRARDVYTASGYAALLLRGPNDRPLLLTETRGDQLAFTKKVALPATAVPVSVGRDPAIWVAGGSHVVTFGTGTTRIAGNTLAWVSGGLTLRLEAKGLTEADARRIARSIR